MDSDGNKTPTILSLGDSLSMCVDAFSGYRQFLIPALHEKGVAFRFIGPNEDAVSPHAGYGGRNTQYLLGISKEVYSQYPSDFVLLHSGHNSFNKDKPVPGILKATEEIIDNIHEINPNVTILLAQVILAGKLPKYSYIPELNKKLEILAERLVKEGYRVILVDQSDGFVWQTDTIEDKVHPNESGASKMAARWMSALLPLLEEYAAKQHQYGNRGN